jgi:ATP-binding cassette subfamily B protein
MAPATNVLWPSCLEPGTLRAAWLSVALAVGAAALFPVPVFMAWIIVESFTNFGAVAPFPFIPCLAAVLAVAASGCLRVFSSYFSHAAAFDFGKALRLRLMEHLGRVPLHWFGSQSSGALKKHLTSDVDEVENFIAHDVTDLSFCLVLPIFCVICLSAVDIRMGGVLLTLLGCAMAIQILSFRKMRSSDFIARYYTAAGQMHADVVEFVQGMPDIKIFNRTAKSFGRLQRAIDHMRTIQDEMSAFSSRQWARFMLAVGMPLTALGCFGAYFYTAGTLSLPDLALCLMLGSVSLQPLTQLMRFAAYLMMMLQSWKQIRALLALSPEKRGERTKESMGSCFLEVSNLNVCRDGRTILKNISFTAAPGTVTAIVGPSGSGKSTLAAVLAGLEQARSGRIALGGTALEEFSAIELSRLFSVVFQQPFIFRGSVRENICLGREDATQEEIEKTVEAAYCRDMIQALPQGYDTLIGAGGQVHLSGGQKQRLALARMALRDAPFVLLDEATAFADPESEAAIHRGLASCLQGKTVLVIAHRLSSIAGADAILVLDHGEIVESGRHAELLTSGGVYAQLWKAHQTVRSWSISKPRKQASAVDQRCPPIKEAL